MRSLPQQLAIIVVTLWVGAMWTVGYIVAPTLFSMLPDRVLAGHVAGRLFEFVGWLGVGSAVYLLALVVSGQGKQAFRSLFFWVVALMLVLTMAGSFGIQPLMAALKVSALPADVMSSPLRDRFVAWHGVSSVLYLVQSLLGLVLTVVSRRVLR